VIKLVVADHVQAHITIKYIKRKMIPSSFRISDTTDGQRQETNRHSVGLTSTLKTIISPVRTGSLFMCKNRISPYKIVNYWSFRDSSKIDDSTYRT
jgi:hypothetical protein